MPTPADERRHTDGGGGASSRTAMAIQILNNVCYMCPHADLDRAQGGRSRGGRVTDGIEGRVSESRT